MEYRGVEIKLYEGRTLGVATQTSEYSVSCSNGRAFGAGSKFGQAWAKDQQTVLDDAKQLIDAKLK